MIRKRSIQSTGREAANAVHRDSPDPATIHRRVCRGLETRMAALEEAGWALKWPVVRAGRGKEALELRVDSPYFFLNGGLGKGVKQTSAGKRVRPTAACRVDNYGYGDQFVVAMRNPDTRVVDVILYAEGLMILYRNSLSTKESMECLAAMPSNPGEWGAFVERAVEAVASHLTSYLSRMRKPPTIQVNRDILSRNDLARILLEKIVDAGGGPWVLDAEVERVADDWALAKTINEEDRVRQLEYLLRTVGEVRTRNIVSRCIQAVAPEPRAAVA